MVLHMHVPPGFKHARALPSLLQSAQMPSASATHGMCPPGFQHIGAPQSLLQMHPDAKRIGTA
eukprot:353600-Chlamydomonas_euryale.AAC.4